MSTGGWIGAVVGGTIGWFIGGPMGALQGAALGAGLGMWIDPLEPESPSPGQLDTSDVGITTAEEGIIVSDVLGTAKIIGNLIWYGKERVEESTEEYSTGKGGGDTEDVVTGYKYYMSWAIGLCIGPVDQLLTIFADDTVVWQGVLENPVSGGEETITLGVIDDESSMGTMTFYFGTSDQIQNSVMSTELGSTANPAYRNFCYAFFNDCYIGSYNRMPTMKFMIKKAPVFGFNVNNEVGVHDYNPAHAIYYALSEHGKLSTSYLNSTAFSSMATTLNTEGIGISMFFSSQMELITYIETILTHAFAILKYGNDGTFQPKLLRDDESIGSLPVINEDSMLDDLQLSRPSWIDTINELKVKYTRITGEILAGEDEGVLAAGNQLGDPWRSVIRDSSNNLHVVFRGTSAHIYHSISSDLGVTWTTTQIFTTGSNTGWVGAAIDSEDVITAVWYNSGEAQSDRLKYAQYDGSWGSQTTIPVSGEDVDGTSFAFASNGTPLVLVDPNNNVYIIFMAHTGLSNGSRIASTRKMKAGSTWATWEQIADNLGEEDAGLFGSNTGDYNATFSAQGDYMHVVAGCLNSGNSAVNLVYARGIYQNWVETDQVTDMTWHNKCLNPTVVIDYQNVPNIVWEWRETTNYQVRFTRGSPGSWVEETIVGTQSASVIPTISVSNNRLEIHVFYLKPTADIYHVRRYFGGYSWAWDSEELLKDLANYVTDLSALYTQFPSNQNPDEGYLLVYRDSDGVLKFYSDVLWETEGGIDVEEAALMIADSANQSVVDRINHKSIQFGLYTNETSASWGTEKMMKRLSYPLANISFQANRDLFRYEPGDLFKLTYTSLSITNSVYRVVSVSEEAPDSEIINVQALEDIDYLGTALSWTAPISQGVASSWAVEPIDVIDFIEPPYYLTGDKLTIGVVTARQIEKQIGVFAYISSDNLSYRNMGTVGIMTPYATLDGSYSSDTYKIDDINSFNITFSNLSTISGIRTLSRTELFGDFNLCMLGDEIMAFQTFTFVSGTTYTISGIIRGLLDTEAVDHSAGEAFWFLDEKYFNYFDHSFIMPNTLSYFKAIMYNSRKIGTLANAERHSVTITGRARKPYKPSNLKANLKGNYASYSENILLEWAPRVRGDGAGVNDADTTTDAIPTWEGAFLVEVYVNSVLVRTTNGIDANYYLYEKEMNEGDNGGTYPSSIEFRVKNYIYIDSNYFYSDYVSVIVTYDVNAPSSVSLPPGNRWEVVIYDDGRKIYSLISFDGYIYATHQSLLRWRSGSVGAWEEVTNSVPTGLGNLIEFGSKLYAATTSCSDETKSGLYEWDGANEMVMVSDVLDTPTHSEDRLYFGSLAVYDSKIYAAYGWYDYLYKTIHPRFLEWNGVDAWVEKATPGEYISALCVLGGKLYSIAQSDIALSEWDEVGDSWTLKAQNPDIHGPYTAVVHNGNIYTSCYGELYEWSGGASWTKVADQYDTETKYVMHMIVFDGYILASTGNDGRLLRWNGIDAWESVADHPSNYVSYIATYDMKQIEALVEYDGKVYAAGDGSLLEWGGA